MSGVTVLMEERTASVAATKHDIVCDKLTRASLAVERHSIL